MQEITFKRGDTFAANCTYQTTAGMAIDIGSHTIAARIADDESLADDLTVTVTDAAAGQFTISATAAATALWPINTYARLDIEYTLGSAVQSTETLRVVIVPDITP